jgi:hypothetical protein
MLAKTLCFPGADSSILDLSLDGGTPKAVIRYFFSFLVIPKEDPAL